MKYPNDFINKIKFAACSDLHLGICKYGRPNLETGINTRLEEDLNQLDKVINFTIKDKKDLFLIGGDTFNSRHPDDTTKKEFSKRLNILIKNRITTIILMGNHEGTTNNNAHCLSSEIILANSKYLHIIDDIKEIEYNGINILCLPYFRKNINIEEKIESLKKKTLVLGHFTVAGAKKDKFTFAGENYIKPEVFNNKNVISCILGHIHHGQQIGNIIYTGSINRINFSDEGNQKSFISGEIIKNKCYMYVRKIDSREFLTINEKWDKHKLKSRISKIDVKNKIVKLIIKTDSATEIIPVISIRKYLKNKSAIIDSIKIERKQEIIVRDKKYQNELNPIKLLKHFLKKESRNIIAKGVEILGEIK